MPLRPIQNAVSSDWFDRFARVGYSAKGVTFGMLGLLMIRVGLGSMGEQADFYGAFEEIGDQPLNFALLGLLSLGLFCYAGWRVTEGLLDVEGEGSGVRGWTRRVLYIVIGLTYGLMAVWAAGILAGWSTDDDGIRDITVMAMEWPLGEFLVGAVGLLVLVSGLVEIYFALSRRFEIEFAADEVNIGPLQRWTIEATGFLGHLSRGIVYGAAGFFAIRAAVEFDPDEARGLADTIREIATQPFGTWLVLAVGAGFIAFGVYCVMLAFHRHIPNEGVIGGGEKDAVGDDQRGSDPPGPGRENERSRSRKESGS